MKPRCAPAFSITIFISTESRLEGTTSREMMVAALSTVLMSSTAPFSMEVLKSIPPSPPASVERLWAFCVMYLGK